MSKLKHASLFCLAAIALMGCDNSSTKKATIDGKNASHDKTVKVEGTDVDINKVSEALGNFIGRNLNSPGIHFDLENIIKGIREGAAGKPSPMNDQEYETTMAQLQQQAVVAVSSKNLDAANAFMKENAQAKGVIEIIPEKLQYIVLEEGTGPAVVEHGTPQITYVGKYIDGTVFGDSTTAGGAITVPLDQTIPGFSKGIVGMKEGEKRRLFVHPEVGYGTSGQLLPNSLLIFDIEVIVATSPEKETAEAFHGDTSDYEDGQDNSSDEQNTPRYN